MNIQKTTRDLFGTDLGQRLLDNQAIIPLSDKRPARGIVEHNNGVDLSKPFGEYNGLGFLNGPRSGILVVDLDTHDLIPPAPFNVETTKGGHVYTRWDGQPRKTAVAPKVDLLGFGGYTEFAGPGKKFVSPNLAEESVVFGWLGSMSLPSLKGVLGGSTGRGFEESVWGDSKRREYETAYPDKVRQYGYELRTETIGKRYATAMRRASEGERNTRLFRYGLEVIRCGADIEELAQAALDAGLPWDEVERTLVSADSTLAMDPRPEEEVLSRVQRWMDHYGQLPGIMAGVATVLAFEAVACNTSRPLLSQTKAAVDLGIHRTYVGKALGYMETKHGAVKKYVNHGTWGDGMKHCNNYALTIDGEEI